MHSQQNKNTSEHMKVRVDFATLLATARAVAGEFATEGCISAASVGAALLDATGAVHTGVCFDAPCGIGCCAEHSAVARMLEVRQSRILACVAATAQGEVLPPCGRCRELMYQLSPQNLDAQILLSADRALPLRELLPHPWNYQA